MKVFKIMFWGFEKKSTNNIFFSIGINLFIQGAHFEKVKTQVNI